MIALPRDRRLPLTAANTLPSWRVTICAKISLLQHPKQLYCVLLIFRCPQNSLWCRLLELGALLPLTEGDPATAARLGLSYLGIGR